MCSVSRVGKEWGACIGESCIAPRGFSPGRGATRILVDRPIFKLSALTLLQLYDSKKDLCESNLEKESRMRLEDISVAGCCLFGSKQTFPSARH